MKKIIGYKAPFDMEYIKVEKGDLFIRNNKTYYPQKYKSISQGGQSNLPKEIVETWEPVYEKDYEILSFKNESFGTIWIKAEDGKFYPEQGVNSYCNKYQIEYHTKFKGTSESWFLSFPDKWKIHSIKRLSDEKIFTVGDKCNLSSGNGYRCPILRFEISYNTYGLEKYRNRETLKFVLGTGYNEIKEWGPFEIDSCVHSKKEPLFITEDGVDIYEGDIFWRVDKNLNNPYVSLPVSKQYIYKHYIDIGTKHFSTKEKAQEYLDSLKPKALFTTVDGKEIFEGDSFYVYENNYHKCMPAKGGQFQNEKWQNFRYADINIVLDLIFKNKPCLSLEDVASIYKTADREKPENPNDQGTKLYNLVRQKLNK